MNNFVSVAPEGSVRLVTLNRPEKRNALSIPLRRELATTFAHLSADPEVGVVVLTGAGSVFCAGMDTTQFGGDDANRRDLFESTLGLFHALHNLSKPVIAAVNGPAIAGGLALVTGSDLRLASPSATFSMPEIAFGFAASYATLRRALPDQIARRLAYTGETLDASAALHYGLVMEIASDVVDRAMHLAREIGKHKVSALEGTKRMIIEAEDPVLRSAADAEMRTFAASLFRKR